MAQPKEQWGTRLGVILAVAGSAVGLGNFLRFPGQAAANGGGAFMIPYFCALIFLGIPICWAEWIMGRAGGKRGYNSFPGIFGVLGRRPGWRYVGVVGLIIPICVYMFYVIIESWCLGYAWHYLVGGMNLGNDSNAEVLTANSQQFYRSFVGYERDGDVISAGLGGPMLFWIITFAINFFLIFRGVTKGIEAFCIRAMPLMVICAAVVLVRVLTLGTPNTDLPEQNVVNGLGFMWNPKGPTGSNLPWYYSLLNAQTWLAAAGQIFFSLSVGFGIIVNYASYLKKDDDVVLSGLTAASTNEFFEVCLGGLITLTAAFVFLGAGGAETGGYSLAFATLPVVFEFMGGIGRIVGFCWFFMLFLAAITSSLSMLQPAIAFLEEGFQIGRKASVTILGLITAMGSGFVVYFSANQTALNTVDFWIGTAMIFVLAMIEVILFSWVYGVDEGYEEAKHGAELTLPPIWKFVIKYISPTFLIIVFVAWCWQSLPGQIDQIRSDSVVMMSILLIASVSVFLLILIHLASRRWNGLRNVTEAVAQTDSAT